MNNIIMYCVTDKVLDYFQNIPYKFAGVGNNNFPQNYLLSNSFLYETLFDEP